MFGALFLSLSLSANFSEDTNLNFEQLNFCFILQSFCIDAIFDYCIASYAEKPTVSGCPCFMHSLLLPNTSWLWLPIINITFLMYMVLIMLCTKFYEKWWAIDLKTYLVPNVANTFLKPPNSPLCRETVTLLELRNKYLPALLESFIHIFYHIISKANM